MQTRTVDCGASRQGPAARVPHQPCCLRCCCLQQLNAQHPSQTRPQPPLPPLAAMIFWRELKRSVGVEQGASARVGQTGEHEQPVAGKYFAGGREGMGEG